MSIWFYVQVCQTFFVEDEVAKNYAIDAVVTVVDAKHISQHLSEEKPEGVENESEEQLAFADRILLNKIDLVEEADLERVQKEIKGINKYATIIRTQLNAQAPNMDQILGLNAFDLGRVEEMDPEFLNEDEEHIHDQRVTSLGFSLGPDEQLNLGALQEWIGTLIKDYANDLFRYKGVIAVKGMANKFVFQGVHMLFAGNYAAPWGDQTRNSCFCFIGRDLNKMNIEEGFRQCIAKPLRFKVGQRVEANVGRFTPGTVIKLWDDGNPYRIRLFDGKNTEVWGPFDDDRFVRAPRQTN